MYLRTENKGVWASDDPNGNDCTVVELHVYFEL